ncbi:MAG: GNAT family N-acetyltransferase [Lachnospiraceae bacterium]|nr:GNAT family N-acetyltransferase [Lachnospiraceae bacterium]
MLITDYQEKYKEQIIQLILTIQNQEAGINLSLDEQPDLRDIDFFYTKNGGHFWLAVNEQDEVIGTIALMNKKGGVGILKKFFVRSDCRGQKIGLQLYSSLLNFCTHNNIKTLILDTPAVAAASHRFYERNGFVQITRDNLPIPYDFPDRNSYLYLKRI